MRNNKIILVSIIAGLLSTSTALDARRGGRMGGARRRTRIGARRGAVRGARVGARRGAIVGARRGAIVGARRGARVGARRGAIVGARRGARIGARRGAFIGARRRGWARPAWKRPGWRRHTWIGRPGWRRRRWSGLGWRRHGWFRPGPWRRNWWAPGIFWWNRPIISVEPDWIEDRVIDDRGHTYWKVFNATNTTLNFYSFDGASVTLNPGETAGVWRGTTFDFAVKDHSQLTQKGTTSKHYIILLDDGHDMQYTNSRREWQNWKAGY